MDDRANAASAAAEAKPTAQAAHAMADAPAVASPPSSDEHVDLTTAVTKAQALVRGFSARKVYAELLYEKFEEEEREREELERQRREEGFKLLQRKDTERSLRERSMLEDHERKAALLHAPPKVIEE